MGMAVAWDQKRKTYFAVSKYSTALLRTMMKIFIYQIMLVSRKNDCKVSQSICGSYFTIRFLSRKCFEWPGIIIILFLHWCLNLCPRIQGGQFYAQKVGFVFDFALDPLFNFSNSYFQNLTEKNFPVNSIPQNSLKTIFHLSMKQQSLCSECKIIYQDPQTDEMKRQQR